MTGPRGSAPQVRPRYGRLAAFSASVLVTAVALLGGVGVLPSGGSPSYAATGARAQGDHDRGAISLASGVAGREGPGVSTGGGAESEQPSGEVPAGGPVPVPEESGSGRRVVFSISQQRVWLVREDGDVARTYLVSGSVYDNLEPGTYEVYSKSEDAVGIDDSGTMKYMVRFAHGENAAIGFHDIPVLEGRPVQTRADLGTAQSHGCIRQWRPDAKALWRFAPVGAKVVVTG